MNNTQTTLAITIFIVVVSMLAYDNYQQKLAIARLDKELTEACRISSKRLVYLNRRIDQLDIAIAESNRTANSARIIAERHLPNEYEWMEGKTTDEIDSLLLAGTESSGEN